MSQSQAKKDSVTGNFLPTGIRFGWDALSTVKSFGRNDFKGWEMSGDIDFRHYYLTVDVGNWQRDVNLENGNYTNNGNYWRAGIDMNMLKKDPVKNMVFLGFRIGHSKYDEQLQYFDTTAFGIFNKTISNKGFKSNWAELTLGMKVKVFKVFWMGYTARMRFFPSFTEGEPGLQTYDIPGYGLTFKKPWWGFNYYLMFRIPIRKDK
jgi:hypothetical protein